MRAILSALALAFALAVLGAGCSKHTPAANEALVKAIVEGDTAAFKAALGRSPGLVNSRDEHGLTLLHLAAARGEADIVKLLLAAGVDVNATDPSEDLTPIRLVFQQPREGFVAVSAAPVTVKPDAVPVSRFEPNTVPARTALRPNTAPAAQAKPEPGATPTAPAQNTAPAASTRPAQSTAPAASTKPASAAAPTAQAAPQPEPEPVPLCFDPQVAKLLLDKGADPNSPDERGRTLLMIAAQDGWQDVAGELIAKGANLNARDKTSRELTALDYAIGNGRLGLVKLLLDKGANPNSSDESGRTPLMIAAQNGWQDTTEQLIAKGADVNAKDKARHPQTVVDYAVLSGQQNLVKLLLDKGANPPPPDEEGHTLLMTAAQHGWKTVAQELVAKGADVNAKHTTRRGQTVLDYAVLSSQPDIVRLLLDKGANPPSPDEQGRTLLMLAAQKGWRDVAETLITKGSDVNAKDKTPLGWTVLDYAVLNARPEVIKLLLDQGASLPAPDELGRTLLMNAARNGWKDVVETLISKGADVNAQDKTKLGLTVLACAVLSARADLVELILDKGADINAKNADGMTALEVARAAQDYATPPGPPTSLIDFVRRDTLEAVKGRDFKPVIELLQKRGGKE